MLSLLRYLLVAAALTGGIPSLAAPVWFGDKQGVRRVDADVNRVDLNVAFDAPVALAVNASDGSVWALNQHVIAKFSATGAPVFAVALNSLSGSLGSPRGLALNPGDGSVWLAGVREVLRLDSSGTLLLTLRTSAEDMSVAQDGTLWLLAQDELDHYAADGSLLRRVALSGSEKLAKFLALDDSGDGLWLGGQKSLVKRSLADPARTLLSVTSAETLSGLAVDIQTGVLWLLGQQSLIGVLRDGSVFLSKDLRGYDIANPQVVVFDVPTQAVWVGHQKGISRLDGEAGLVATIPAVVQVGTVAIGRAPVNVTPTLAFVAPRPESTVATGTPTLSFSYGANCSGVPCGFPGSYFSTYSLAALVNGTSVGPLFTFDPATGLASWTPTSRLPEGANLVSGQVTDALGRQSDPVSARFFIDTVAPRFVSVTPESGSVFAAAQITVQGSVDDPAATVSLNGTTSGATFSFPLTLSLGTANYSLVATDPVGNVATQTLIYTWDPPNALPTVAITSPANGANFTAPASIPVAADASDSDGSIASVEFFSNGGLLATDTSAPYATTLSAPAAGTYELTARATDNRGGVTISAAVTVTVGTPNAAPTVAITSPAAGSSFTAPASIRVVATASDSDGTVARVEFLRNGALAGSVASAPFVFTLTDVPAGNHTITARAVDDRGASTTSAPVSVAVRALALSIASPASGASVQGNQVLVSGSFTGPGGSGVVVNGVAAAMSGNTFLALVPVVAGGNTLAAVLTAPEGQTASQSISIDATGVAPAIAASADPVVGMAPLAVAFTVANTTGIDASYTFDGFGPFDVPAGATSVISLTYPAGVFAPTIVVTDAAGGTTTQRFVIEAIDEGALDQKLRAIWNAMNAALLAGDKDRAMNYLNIGAKEKYGPVFDVLMPSMASIQASYSTLARASLSPEIGEYAIRRLHLGVQKLYFIHLLRDADGVWRIDEM